jgi:hypothetical protein
VAGKVVTSAVAVAAAPAAEEAKKPKTLATAPPPDAPDAAAVAATLAQQQADDEELMKARKFWQDWTAAKGNPEPNDWSAEHVWLWCVRRARSMQPSVCALLRMHAFELCSCGGSVAHTHCRFVVVCAAAHCRPMPFSMFRQHAHPRPGAGWRLLPEIRLHLQGAERV